jgi:ketosteroid isomerase-like protein
LKPPFTLINAESLAMVLLVLVAGFLVVLFTTDSFRARPPGQRNSGFQLFGRRRHRRGPHLVLLLIAVLSLGYLVWHQASRPVIEITTTALPANDTPLSSTQVNEATVVLPVEAASPLVVADPTAEVAAAIETWRLAWAARDVESYLAAYAANFAPADGQSLVAWQAQRKGRLRNARGIRVDIDQLSIEADGDRASARFMQRYRSGTASDRVWKRLDMLRTADGWKIISETVDKSRIANSTE